MSKKGDSSNPASDAQAAIAQQLFEQTNPLRTSLIGQSTDFLNGGNSVTATPAFAALKGSADQNFNRAKDNVIATNAPGGGLTDALTSLEGQRASTLTQGAGALYGDEMSRALTLGTGITQQANSGLAAAGSAQAAQAAAQAQATAGKAGAIGTGVGALLGGK